MDWIIKNSDWLFSGIAIAIPLAIIGYLFNKNVKSKQNQKIGNNSTGYQVGGSININKKDKE